jgi:aldehyde:ferredoxin oxidoreductase
MRAAEKWGRLEEDLATGMLHKPHWGYGWHWSLPFVEQTYSSLVGDREVTEHCFSAHRTMVYLNEIAEKLSAEKLVTMLSKKLIPFEDDPFMLDHNWQEADGSNMKPALETGIYSGHRAKLVAWHRHYTRFWAESILYCDWVWPIWFNRTQPDFSGFTPESEPMLFNAVTGRKLTFAEGMEAGRRIWNLNRAIWVLQGRHRDMEELAGFMFTPAGSHAQTVPEFLKEETNVPLPVWKNGKWEMEKQTDMYLDRSGVEWWKTHYYEVEGWDTATGWPTRKTLEELGLKKAADSLAAAGRLGAP